MNMSKQETKVSSIVPTLYIICLWSWTRGDEIKWRKHYVIPWYPQETKVDWHPILQPVDGACPNEICRSEHENLWPQGSLMTQTVIKVRVKRWMKWWETRPKYPKDNTKPLSVQCQISESRVSLVTQPTYKWTLEDTLSNKKNDDRRDARRITTAGHGGVCSWKL